MTNNSLFFNESLLLPMLIGAVVVWIFFIYKELPVKNKLRFLIRNLVAIIVLLSLLMIILVPIVDTIQSRNKAILLTDNYSQSTLDSLKRTDKHLKILNYVPNAKIIPDSLNIGSLIILGNGIEAYDFWQMQNKEAIFLKHQGPRGIINLSFPEKQRLYSDLIVEGTVRLRNLSDRIILENPNGKTVDSIILDKDEIQEFTLESSLKVSGNFIYNLIEKDSSGKILSSNPIPVQVVDSNPLKILLLLTNPTFESKYLKNFISDNNNQLVARTQLTRGRYKYEYFNLPRIPIQQLTSEQLESFDLIISDREVIFNLSSNELSALQKQIRDNGLGLLYLADQDVFTSKLKISNFEFDYTGTNNRSIEVGSAVKIDKFPYTFKKESEIYAIDYKDDYINSAFKRNGLGKVGATVFRDTYQLLLKGQDSIYKKLWTKVISNLSKPSEKKAELQLDENLYFVDEPMPFKLRTSISNPELLSDQGYRIPLKQDYALPYLWSGLSYPKKTGWQSFSLQQDSTIQLDYYVFKERDWEGIATQNKLTLNELYFNNELEADSTIILRRPINLFYIYLLALFGLGYLWLVPKLGLKNL